MFSCKQILCIHACEQEISGTLLMMEKSEHWVVAVYLIRPTLNIHFYEKNGSNKDANKQSVTNQSVIKHFFQTYSLKHIRF